MALYNHTFFTYTEILLHFCKQHPELIDFAIDSDRSILQL